ncbi:MAG: C-GCAxxG-C-C family protein [Pyrodictiaceae archaeon]
MASSSLRISRRQFLLSAAATMGALAVGSSLGGMLRLSVGRAAVTSPEEIEGEVKPLPYKPLDPEKVKVYAYELYYKHMHCGAGVFGGLVLALRQAVGGPWNNIPIHVLLWQKGGGVGYGATCGALAGAASVISLVLPEKLADQAINQLFRWYETYPFPSWTPPDKLVEQYGKVKGPLPRSISYSILCHVSVTRWCLAARKSSGSPERAERCGRLTGEVAAKAAEILNEIFKTGKVPFVAVDPFTANAEYGCRSCHRKGAPYETGGWTRAKMDCIVCHKAPHLTLTVKRS